jgi:hypothetical protein
LIVHRRRDGDAYRVLADPSLPYDRASDRLSVVNITVRKSCVSRRMKRLDDDFADSGWIGFS